MTPLLKQATAVGLKLQRDRNTLMIEQGIGYWISPDGQRLPIPPRISHADMIRGLIDPAPLSEDEQDRFTADANAFAIEQGWTRVRIYPADRIVYADLGRDTAAQHRKLVDELLDGLGLVGYRVKSTDEEGNYSSG